MKKRREEVGVSGMTHWGEHLHEVGSYRKKKRHRKKRNGGYSWEQKSQTFSTKMPQKIPPGRHRNWLNEKQRTLETSSLIRGVWKKGTKNWAREGQTGKPVIVLGEKWGKKVRRNKDLSKNKQLHKRDREGTPLTKGGAAKEIGTPKGGKLPKGTNDIKKKAVRM